MPPAPPTFSKSTGWTKSSESRDAKIRPKTSPALPAANGYTIVTGRLGQFCALDCAIVVTIACDGDNHSDGQHDPSQTGTPPPPRWNTRIATLWRLGPPANPTIKRTGRVDRLAHVRHGKRPAVRQRPLPDAEIVGGEVS